MTDKTYGEVTLHDVLNEREGRVMRQNALIRKYNRPLICFTLNIAGPVKRTELSYAAFKSGEKEINRILCENSINIEETVFTDRITGTENIWSVDTEPKEIKLLLSDIEENHPLGRLFDIDIINTKGEKISREEIGLPERGCLLCGAPGPACARNRTHSIEEIIAYTNTMIQNFIKDI